MTANPYLQPARIQAALNALGVRPSKELGQNFLIDAQALQAVVDAANLQPDDNVIEVGPGLGVLTYELVQRAGHVIAIEFDRRLAARLPEAIEAPHLRVIQSDVLRIEPAEVVGATGSYKLVANLPYQITSAILRHFLEAALPPTLSVVMLQREVAERIVARPPRMSVLAHSVQLYTVPEIVTWVPAAAFLPVPKVDSAVLRLRRRPHLAVEVDNVDAFFRVIKAGFLQARKKLGNALPAGLASFGIPLAKSDALDLLKSVQIDPDRRSETLTLEEWAKVYRALGSKA